MHTYFTNYQAHDAIIKPTLQEKPPKHPTSIYSSAMLYKLDVV